MRLARVVVVEDCTAAREAAGRQLQSHGCEVFQAASFDVALAAVAETRFDLAIVDVRLGRGLMFGAGLKLTEAFKESSPWMSVALTSGAMTLELERLAYRLGADLVIEKIQNSKGVWVPIDLICAYFEDGREPPQLDPGQLRKYARVTRDHILNVLRECDGNVSRAAFELGLDRKTIQAKLRELEVTEREMDAPHG